MQMRRLNRYRFMVLATVALMTGCGDLQRARGLAGDGNVITSEYNINESEYFQNVQKGRNLHTAQMLQELNAKAAEVKEENKVEHSSTHENEDGTTTEDTWYEYPDVEVITPDPPLASAMAYLQMTDENILKSNKYIFKDLEILDFYSKIHGEIIVDGGGMSFTVYVDYLPVSGNDAEESEASKLFPSDVEEYIQLREYFADSTSLYETFLSEAGYVSGNDSGYSPGGNSDYIGNISFDKSVGGLVCSWSATKVGLGYSQGEDYHNSRRGECAYCRTHPGSSAGRLGPTHYDCSSLVYLSYKSVGINISYGGSTTAAEIARGLVDRGCQIGYEELQPGDLIFYSTKKNGRYKDISHVVMYLGEGQIVHARSTATGVRTDSVSIYQQSSIRVVARPSGLK